MSRFLMDAHLHIDLYKNRDEVLQYIENQQSYSIAVTNLPSLFEKYYREYGTLKYLKFALGYHPELVAEYGSQMPVFLKNIEYTRYVGEVGLDFTVKDIFNRSQQIEIFKEIVKACNFYEDKILSVHSRRAVKEVYEILNGFHGKVILHWYTGSLQDLQQAIERGYYFSINHQMIRSSSGKKIVESIPLDKLLVETDAPFTYGMKDRYNIEPILDVYNYLAKLNNISIENIMDRIKLNLKTILS